jgi:antitoxin FitA
MRAFCVLDLPGTARDNNSDPDNRQCRCDGLERLHLHASTPGRSMEAEARTILDEAVAPDREEAEPNLAEAIRRRFAPLGGVDLELPPCEDVEESPSFDG